MNKIFIYNCRVSGTTFIKLQSLLDVAGIMKRRMANWSHEKRLDVGVVVVPELGGEE